ncbi:MAG: histidine ammonia-lyase [Candidatus Cloacimonadota bacterium]|nr:MAG: histidine ammonia-lyase [Candidatus Cloacimonadota bacterium]PIE77817.1 MAG: histidine ammonia-lyase [Candidatus Delongbacteria bacterium]
MEKVVLDGNSLTLNQFEEIVYGNCEVEISKDCIERINECRRIVEEIVDSERVRYGINTGFGKFSDVSISKEDTLDLQRNIVLSHSVGVGKPLAIEVVRGMLLLKLNSFGTGNSGVRLVVAELMRDMLNKGVTPVVPEKGSVGASGDLAPLSHMALVMIGEGEAFYNGERLAGKEALEKAGLNPLVLQEKEGLAILNGTQTMASLAAIGVLKAENLMKVADISGAISVEALKGTSAAFDHRVQAVRPHKGQINTAANLRGLLADSKISGDHENYKKVQDAYSLRCMPQVHGAAKDTLRHVRSVVETELNSVTDNPLVFPDKQDVISGGNFHGEPLAMVCDFLAIAVHELSNISERRIEYMLDSATSDGLPAFLVSKGGLNSGYMMAQVTAAALVSENKTLCHPSSVDSIPTSANKEDHVSMGTFAARKLQEVITNVTNVIAVEMLCSLQGLNYRMPLKPAKAVESVFNFVREQIPFMETDRNIHLDMVKMASLISDKSIVSMVEKDFLTLEV